jgi:hypothetical protein
VSRKSLSVLVLVAALATVVWALLRPEEATGPEATASRTAPAVTTKPSSETSAPQAAKIPASPRPESAHSPMPPAPLSAETQTGEEGALSPARTKVRLYGNARIKPLYNLRNNEIDGVEVSGVVPGSFWDELGIDDGDVILELNGELINSPAASVTLMNQFSRGYVLNLRLRTTEGNERFIDYRTPAEP